MPAVVQQKAVNQQLLLLRNLMAAVGAASVMNTIVRSFVRQCQKFLPVTAIKSDTSAAISRVTTAPSKVPAGPDPKVVNVSRHIEELRSHTTSVVDASAAAASGEIGKYFSFPASFDTRLVARPDVEEGELLKVTEWKLLTPKDYDRTCFHIEVDVVGTKMEHMVNGAQGKALSVYATNDRDQVADFINRMGLDPLALVSVAELSPPEEGGVVITTVERLFMQYLDIFGKPTREFLKNLSAYAEDIVEKVTLAELTLERKKEEFMERQGRSPTYADYFLEFKSLRVTPVEKFIDLVPTIKQRVYSICSSSDYRPGKCQLLVVREDWKASDGEIKFGLCSSFLTLLRPAGYLVGHPTHSVMEMPEDKTAPVFMAGLGTGLAPFRAFVEQRRYEKSRGAKVGPMTLFFGGRHAKSEYYYRDEFETYEAEGLVKCCNAWSRDQKEKVYVQHKIAQEAESIWNNFGKQGAPGYFFLCGSKQPEKDVYAALLAIFKKCGGMSDQEAQSRMDKLQASGRYVTEVY